ncbi:MAG: division/cell wall cluster transcriptional repressor MraZ [Nitrospiraceae bacterium]|nr:MAG: division/cell wall cluster transcriptional repressor MraZ [Nitrospiraceae bacterium]
MEESGGKMSGFSGKHYKTLDAKGRLIIPAPFRDILSSNHSSKLIITNEVFDKCLCAYPVSDWQLLIDKVNRMPQTSDAVKYYMRRVIGSAVECEVDKQGRVLLAPALRVDAGLNSDVVVLGLGNRIEIWNREELEGVADPGKVDRQAFKQEFASLGM